MRKNRSKADQKFLDMMVEKARAEGDTRETDVIVNEIEKQFE